MSTQASTEEQLTAALAQLAAITLTASELGERVAALEELGGGDAISRAGAGGGGAPTGPAGGSLAGEYPNPGIGNEKIEVANLTAKARAELKGAGGAPSGPAGGSLAGEYPNPTIAANGVGAEQLAANAVTEPKIAAGAVVETKIANGNVGTNKLAALSVTEPKIAAEAVSEPKIAALAVVTAKLAGEAVTEPKIANLAVTEGKLAVAVQAKLVSIGAAGAFTAFEANKAEEVPAEPTNVYLSISFKAESTTFEVLVDGNPIYKFAKATLTGSSQNLFFDFNVKPGGKWEVKLTEGSFKEAHRSYQSL